MNETVTGTSDASAAGRLPLPGVAVASLEDTEMGERPDAAEQLRAVYEGWLERRGIDLAKVPHRGMDEAAFDVLRNAPDDYIAYVRKAYRLSEDQEDRQYMLVDVAHDDASLPPSPKLVDVTERDFGTTIGLRRIARDFEGSELGPDDPMLPELPGGAYRTIDIAVTLAASAQDLRAFAKRIMIGKTHNPLYSSYGDIGVRAGGIAPGQNDAYVWENSRFAKSVELTLAFPKTYNSVCVVRGQRRDAGNEKPGMAQIEHPEVVLTIEGNELETLQNVYRQLYHEPDFALTEAQRRERNELFNAYLESQISSQASSNHSREYEERRSRQPALRYREIPR